MKNINIKEKQIAEGLYRMKQISEKFCLNPNLVKYLEQGKIYYSYITGGGMIGSIDTIEYDSTYVELIKKFEKNSKGYVYHAIESALAFNNRQYHFLNLLYVSNNEEYWDSERLTEDFISSYVIDLNDQGFSEIGDIFLDGFKGPVNSYNVLVRIG